MRQYLENINADRIDWCCRQTNGSVDQVGEELGLSIEKLRKPALTINQLQKVADHFGYGLLFFLEEGVPPESARAPELRTLANQGMEMDVELHKLIRQTGRHRDIYLGLLEDMNEEARFAPPPLTGSVRDKAAQARRWIGLRDDAPYDFDAYREMIEGKGILVFRSIGYIGKWKVRNEDFFGLTLADEKAPAILIRKTRDNRDAFTLFHELGHLLLHSGSYIDNRENIGDESGGKEREANRFAAALLIPDECIKDVRVPEAVERYREPEYLGGLSKKLGVSVEVVARRLLDAGKIGARAYNQYRQWQRERQWRRENESARGETPSGGSRAWRHREPNHIFGTRYVGAVLDALHSGVITLSRASDYLDRLKIRDIHKLEKYFAGS